ncbi:MAG TPA: DUF3373 domain-containing protein [Geobacteraceae bacterium]
MKRFTRNVATASLLLGMALPATAMAADQDLQQKIDALTKEVEALKQDVSQTKQKSLGRWLEIGGDYRFRFDYLYGQVPSFWSFNNPNFSSWLIGQLNGAAPAPPPANAGPQPAFNVNNNDLFTNRFGLNLKAKATKDVTVTARLLMYKAAGSDNDAAVIGNNNGAGPGPFFADRAGTFDGTIGHVPGDNKLAVDRVYATWNNIAGQPIWLSIGRRPSTGGIPAHLKQDNEKPGNAGVPQILVDYAFDGMTLGYAPDIDALPGAYAKFCYGRGFQNDITASQGNGLNNTDMVGVNIVPYDTDTVKAEFQYNRGFNIFNAPIMLTGPFAGTNFGTNSVELGDIDWYGLSFLGKVKNVGFGNLNWFAQGGMSVTHPNNNLWFPFAGAVPAGTVTPGVGLLENQGEHRSKTGWSVFVGGRYDIESTGTKIGAEYNHGSKDWITFAPAADDMWTSKVGTRGNVYEGYIIQELPLAPISSYISKTFFKVGYQYYDFDYTGSNNWVGAPVKISELASSPMNAQMLTPLKNAQDLYVTFEVHF